MRGRTRVLARCAVFTALTAVCAQLAIPLGPVPVNLATFSVLLAGVLLGPKLGALSQLAYVLLGAAGAPVFALLRGGAAVLLGPTGGFLFGYVAAAWITGALAGRGGGRRRWLSMLAGSAVCLTMGAVWYMAVTHTSLGAALLTAVLPFLPGELLKITAAALVARRLTLARAG